MLCITVAQDGSGDFASISEAVLAVPYDCPAQIRIGAGIYREKLVCEKKDIALQGAGASCPGVEVRFRRAIISSQGMSLPILILSIIYR